MYIANLLETRFDRINALNSHHFCLYDNKLWVSDQGAFIKGEVHCLVLPKNMALHSKTEKSVMSLDKDVGKASWINRVSLGKERQDLVSPYHYYDRKILFIGFPGPARPTKTNFLA